MSKNFKQPGDTIDIPAPSDVSSGAGVLVGKLFGVAAFSAKQGELVALDRKGVFDLPKVSAQAWVIGDVIYWSGTEATTTATNNTKIGYATAAAGNPSARADVLIHQ
jgi:predicted RecA/RadA family phage recombinase